MSDPVRQFPRYAVEAEIELTTGEVAVQGRTRNLSRGGLCAAVGGGGAAIVAGADAMVKISLVFSGDALSEPLLLPARVVWCTGLGDDYQLGCSFLPSLTQEERTYLELFLRYLAEGAAAARAATASEPDELDDHDDDPFAG
jgi:hypothetical protein